MRRRAQLLEVLALLALGVSACGEGDLRVQTTEVQTLGRFQAGLNVGQAGGCSTSVVDGLTTQLVEELNCVAPNLMVSFAGPNVNLYSAVQPYLAPGAAQTLKAAIAQKNDTITVSSAYRSLAQQYLLYKWWQAGQCNIQAAARPGSSNHQSGRAIDVPSYSYWKSALQGNGWQWYGSGDVVHFDYLSSPNVSAKSVLAFQRLWNKNHSNKIAEDSTWGPSTESAMAASPATGFAIHGCQASGTLVGFIYQGGNTANRVSGATVTAQGKTETTGADGKYEFALPPGTYSVSVSKGGFSSNQVSRTVSAGTATWGSMEINPVAAPTGTLKGKVFELVAAAPQDTSRVLGGATVNVGGRALTSDAAGLWELALPPGSYTISVSKAGYSNGTVTRQVNAGAVTWGSVGLAPGASSGEPPTLAITSPAANSALDLASIILEGTASDDQGPIASVELALNGAAPIAVPVTSGRFAHPLKLVPGKNSVAVLAEDSGGRKTALTWKGTFRAGLGGRVHRYDQAPAVLADVLIELIDARTGTEVARARTSVEGVFEIDLTQVPGDFALRASAAGYVSHTQTLAISDEQRSKLDIGLTPGVDGEYSIRFIEPTPGQRVTGPFVNVSGVVSGLQLAGVTANGIDAVLLGDNTFLVKVPVPEGRSRIEVVAVSPEEHSVRAQIEVERELGPISGGCASAAGLPAASALVLLLALRELLTQR